MKPVHEFLYLIVISANMLRRRVNQPRKKIGSILLCNTDAHAYCGVIWYQYLRGHFCSMGARHPQTPFKRCAQTCRCASFVYDVWECAPELSGPPWLFSFQRQSSHPQLRLMTSTVSVLSRQTGNRSRIWSDEKCVGVCCRFLVNVYTCKDHVHPLCVKWSMHCFVLVLNLAGTHCHLVFW